MIISINTSAFMDVVREVQSSKGHAHIDAVITKDRSDFSTVLHSVNPDSIRHIDSTGCIIIEDDHRSLTAPRTDRIRVMDVTPPDWNGQMMQYTIRDKDLSVAFVINYDSTMM